MTMRTCCSGQSMGTEVVATMPRHGPAAVTTTPIRQVRTAVSPRRGPWGSASRNWPNAAIEKPSDRTNGETIA